MGQTVEINSAEDMCRAMCDNVLPKPEKQWWIFTFGCGQQHAGMYVKIYGTRDEARKKMFDKYGREWGFQHSEEEWKSFENDPNRWWPMEKELEVIE